MVDRRVLPPGSAIDHPGQEAEVDKAMRVIQAMIQDSGRLERLELELKMARELHDDTSPWIVFPGFNMEMGPIKSMMKRIELRMNSLIFADGYRVEVIVHEPEETPPT